MENHGGKVATGGKLLILPPKLFGNPTSSHLATKQEDLAKEMNLALRGVFVHTSKGFLTCRKVLWHGANGFTSPPKKDVLRIFITLEDL
jgi:hypothetical protein